MRYLGTVASILVVGCLRVDPVTCPDGSVCPHGSQCDVANHRCITTAQVEACADKADGQLCTADGATGTCSNGACEPAICGDGMREPSEECEGDDLGPLTCERLGYYGGTLTCTPLCTVNLSDCMAVGRCGDGQINGPEICDGQDPAGLTCVDYGFDVGHLGCSSACAPDFSGCGHLGWERQAAPTITYQTGIWASGPRDAYVVGYQNDSSGVVLHYDGHTWSPLTLGIAGVPVSVAGASPSDVDVFLKQTNVYAVAHWDGTSWTSQPIFITVNTSTSTPAGDIYAAGFAGQMSHRAPGGATWDVFQTGTTYGLYAMAARTDTDIWAVGDNTALHFDGTTWSPVNPGATGYFTGVAVLGAQDVFIHSNNQVLGWDGTSWRAQGGFSASLQTMAATPTAVFIVAPSIIWTLGADHSQWIAITQSVSNVVLSKVGGDRAGHLWALGTGTVSEYRGSAWLNLSSPMRVWGLDATHVFGSDCSIYTGGWGWTALSGTYCNQLGVWATSATNVYTVGAAGAVMHFDGTSWATQMVANAELQAVWGSGPTNIYAAGKANNVVHYDGTTWQPVTPPAGANADWYAIWGSDASHVLVVGSQGYVLRYNGTQWTSSQPAGPNVTWRGVWGSSPNDVWLVGDGGSILHFDGQTWSPTPAPTVASLNAISGSARNDVFIAGDAGTMLHFDGKHWDLIASPGIAPLTSVWSSGRYVFFGTLTHVLDRSAYPSSGCVASETSCADGVDDDCDLLVDCADPDCRGTPACP